MNNKILPIQAVRGMNDILPNEIGYWHYLEEKIRELVATYGYQEIRFPIIEKTALFKRSIGEVTDIVEKEMYVFDDRNGESLALRPEGTASCVRAGIEHGLLYNQIQRLWYLGPVFRHERPQKGRYRQFYQLGVEAFGMTSAHVDAELILLSAKLWRALGIDQQVSLQINSLGSLAARVSYREKLVHYFNQHQEKLDEDSQRRLKTNPLRILDSKNPALTSLIAEAPRLIDHLDPESKAHFHSLCELLNTADIRYEINSHLVRGLDYYNSTVFEWVTQALGTQDAICAGGRYDNLVELLGGKPTPAVGFAIGLDRVILLLQATKEANHFYRSADVYFMAVGEQAKVHGLRLIEQLRRLLPEVVIVNDCTESGFKAQFKRADLSGAKFALILGENELANGQVTLKYLREERSQETIELKTEKDFSQLAVLLKAN